MADIKTKYLNHPRHKNIRFEDNHPEHGRCYLYNDTDVFTGYTAIIGKFKNRFDTEGIANGVAAKMRREGKDITAEQVLNIWATKKDAASLYGTMVHDEIEHFHKTGELTGSEFVEAVIKHTKGLEHVAAESVIYNEHIKSATQVDDIFTDGKELFLFDFKTNKKIEISGYKDQMMHPPLDHLPDCNFTHYSLQLNLERRWLEKFYELPISKQLKIIRFWTPFAEDWNSDECSIVYDIPDLQQECELIEEYLK